MVGWVRLSVRGEKGMTIVIRYAEALNPDGTLYTTNLRTARNTDHYTLNGEGEEIWEPRFTFHGFRYVELQGLPEVPTEETVTGIAIHSEMPSIGMFECSDPLINQLQHNIVWGQKGNFVDVPTDCPQRDERLGWTGDAQVFVRTAAFNRDVAGFFTKWTCDLEDSQSPDGEYPKVAPNLSAWGIGADGGPAWADAGVNCPWTIYQCYGDIRLLEEHYPSMQHFIEFLSRTGKNGLRCYAEYTGWQGHGDWLALEFDLLPEELRHVVANELVQNIQSREDHLSTGFVGTPYINWVLSRTGHLDTAYTLLNKLPGPRGFIPLHREVQRSGNAGTVGRMTRVFKTQR